MDNLGSEEGDTSIRAGINPLEAVSRISSEKCPEVLRPTGRKVPV